MKGEQPGKNANLIAPNCAARASPRPWSSQGQAAVRQPGRTISAKDIAFSRQLATMMKSGVPIVASLEIIAGGQKNPKFRT